MWWLVPGIVGINILLLGLVIIMAKLYIDQMYSKILHEIKSSVEPKFLDVSPEVSAMADLGVEVWRLNGRLEKIPSKGDDGLEKGLESSMQKLVRYLETHDIEVQGFENKPFNEGMNVDVLSVIEGKGEEPVLIKETVEPGVFSKGKLIRKAKVILIKGEDINE